MENLKFRALGALAFVAIITSGTFAAPAQAQVQTQTDTDARLVEILSQLQRIIEQFEALKAQLAEQEPLDAEVVVDVVEEEEEEEVERVDRRPQPRPEAIPFTFEVDTRENNDQIQSDDEGVFILNFGVTAFGTDLFVNRSAEVGTTLTDAGVNFIVRDGSGNTVSTFDGISASLSSAADVEGGRYIVEEDTTEAFTLAVTVDPVTDDFFAVELLSLNFSNSNADPDQQQRFSANDFETSPVSIDN